MARPSRLFWPRSNSAWTHAWCATSRASARARKALSGPSLELVDALYDFTMRGGKRTRPAVLVAGHMAVSQQTNLEALLDPCAGLELLQSYLLVHDDWMDQDDERRGGPTLHKVFADRTGDRHLGASLSVLAGDLGNGFAIELVAGATMPETAARRGAAGVLGDAAGRGLGPGARPDRLPGRGADPAPQDRQLQREGTAPAGRRDRRRAAPRSSLLWSATPTRSGRPSRAATTSSAPSAHPRRPASPPATTCALASARR